MQNVFGMNNKLLAALVVLMFTACAGPITPPGEDLTASSEAELRAARRPAPTPVWKAQLSQTPTNPVFATTFTIATTYDLYVAFDIPVSFPGQHIAAFEFVSPDGAVYQRTEVPFSPGTAKSYRVWSAMPVAATWIQQFAMTGNWKVQVFLNGESAPRATQTFVLQ